VPNQLQARAGSVLDAERFAVAPVERWSYPEPIARQRVGTRLGAVLYALRHGDGSSHVLYGLYSRDPATESWIEFALGGSPWFVEGFRQPAWHGEQPLLEWSAMSSTHGGDWGDELIRLIPGRVVEGVSALAVLEDGREASCEISSLGTFIVLSVSRPGSPPPRLRVRRGDRETTVDVSG